MKKISAEFKVGLFIVLCFAGLVYLSFSTGKVNIRKDGYYIYAIFDDISGLQKKAPVMVNGMEMGKVDDVKISYQKDKTSVILKLWLDRKAKVKENPLVSIKTLGLMGEKYIQISSGSGKDYLEPNATVSGKPYADIDQLVEQAQSISQQVGNQVSSLMANLNSTVSENKEGVSEIVKNLEATSRNFEEFSLDLKAHPWKLLFKGKDKREKTK